MGAKYLKGKENCEELEKFCKIIEVKRGYIH